jgi:hypothetical protein
MPVFQLPVLSNKASTDPVVSGLALTQEMANQAPHNRRRTFHLRPVLPTTGATVAEAFIDGTPNFRLRFLSPSTAAVDLVCTYTSSVPANNCVIRASFGVSTSGVASATLANGTVVKMPTAAVPGINFTASGQDIQITVAGAAGDTNGRWNILASLVEVTDIG